MATTRVWEVRREGAVREGHARFWICYVREQKRGWMVVSMIERRLDLHRLLSDQDCR